MRALWITAALLFACEGRVFLPGESQDTPIDPTPVEPLPPSFNTGWPTFRPVETFQLRRLTTEQYLASVKSLLFVSTQGIPPLEPVSPVAGFQAIGAASALVSGAGVSQFEDASRFLARAAFTDQTARQRLAPCTPTGATDTACFTQFVNRFGQRAFRRPLTADEVTRYVGLAVAVTTSTNDVWQGLELTVTAFLQSPSFLYLAETGEADPSSPGRFRYTAYEMASRLSYFLTNDTPDDELLQAASSGALLTADGVRAQTERLLALPQAHAAIRTFFGELLALGSLDTLSRPAAVFPAFTPTIGAAMKEETLRSFEALVFDRDGDYRQVFDTRDTYVNAELASFYGVQLPAGGGFQKVTLPDGAPRLGLLGQAGVLATRDHSDGTSPTKRGLFVLTRLLCKELALAPPAGLDIPPPPTGRLTQRQRLEQHVKNATCASCHKEMDSVGLSLERFDALGAYRETEWDLPIDDHGELGNVKYDGLAGLGQLLATHPALGPCLIQSLYGSSVGHLVTDFDKDTFTQAVAAYDAGGARIRAVLTAITQSDGFRAMPAPN